MNVEQIKPNVITYRLTSDKNDEEYSLCMWAEFIFDCDAGQLNINSDVGVFSYRWGFNEHENFMNLMARIDKEYLINKISKRSVLKLEESKKKTIDDIKEFGIDNYEIENEDDLKDIIEQINDIKVFTEEDFYNEINQIVPNMDWESICCEKDYPYGAKIICDLFKKYIQSKIKDDFININHNLRKGNKNE